MAQALNRRLTTTDAAFLYQEKPNQPMHIGSVNIYDGPVSKAELMRIVEERLHRIPRYRQRVVFPPFGVAHPTWEDDEHFDLNNHIEEMDLPAPGDDRVLSEVGGQIFAQVLDRNRPLWKLVLLHGLADGGTAMLSMVHHAMVDGVSGVELQMTLHDLSPSPEPQAPPTPWAPEPMPDSISLLQDAVRDRLTEVSRLWTDESFRMFRPRETRERTEQITNALNTTTPYVLRPAPPTPFNGPLSNRRQFAWAEFTFSEIRAIRQKLGGTINDVVLGILSGGLGRYLRAKGINTDGVELRAMCPVNVRAQMQRGTLGNVVSMMIAPLYVGILDPVERLNAERGAMERLKDLDQAGGLFNLTSLADSIPPAWQALAQAFDTPNTLLNTVSTNVPGPQIPLYLGGRQQCSWYPLGPCASNIGLFNAILSYNQKLTFGATVDPALVPDVWFYMDCIKESFAEVLEAAGGASPVMMPVFAPKLPAAATGRAAAPRRRKAAGAATG